MNQTESLLNTTTRYVHEVLFSVNIGLAIMAAMVLYAPRSFLLPLTQMEISINRFLHIRQTDFVRGYWGFFVPATVLALCIWVLLRLSRRTRLTKEALRAASGIVALALAPAWWFGIMYEAARRYGWNVFRTFQLYEVTLIVLCALLYLRGKWVVPNWVSFGLFLAHSSFWIWQFGPYHASTFLSWQVAPFAGLCSGLIWTLYISQQRTKID